MNLDTGEITQLTDEPASVGAPGGITKTPDSRIVVYCMGNKIKKLVTATGEIMTVYTETGGYTLGSPSIARNRRYVAFCRNERVSAPRGPNYTGFKESFYLVKDGRVTLGVPGWLRLARRDQGHALGRSFPVLSDDSTLGTYCHEGP